MKHVLFFLIVTSSTLVSAGPIDNCYNENVDLRDASLCADKFLARKIRQLQAPSSRLKSCTLTVCVWKDLNDPESRHDYCSDPDGNWKYINTLVEARNEANALDIFADRYEDKVEARAAVTATSCK